MQERTPVRSPSSLVAGMCGNRTHLPHCTVRNNGFEAREAHQGPIHSHFCQAKI